MPQVSAGSAGAVERGWLSSGCRELLFAPVAHSHASLVLERLLEKGGRVIAAGGDDVRNRQRRIAEELEGVLNSRFVDLIENAFPCGLAEKDCRTGSCTSHDFRDVIDAEVSVAGIGADELECGLDLRIWTTENASRFSTTNAGWPVEIHLRTGGRVVHDFCEKRSEFATGRMQVDFNAC